MTTKRLALRQPRLLQEEAKRQGEVPPILCYDSTDFHHHRQKNDVKAHMECMKQFGKALLRDL